MKSPSVSVGWHRCFTRSFRRLECLWLFDFKPGHEPVELLPGQLFYFQLISGPAESALDFHTFIQQHKSVRFPEQSFDPVTTFSTEKIQGTSPWIHMELILYNSTQPVIPGLIAILARWCSSYCSSSSGRIGRVPTRLMEPPYVNSGTTFFQKYLIKHSIINLPSK